MHVRRIVLGLATALAVALVAAASAIAAPAASAGTDQFCFTSFSYGTRVLVGSAATSGPSSPSQIGCTSRGPISRANTSNRSNQSRIATTGTMDTRADTTVVPVHSHSTSTVHGVNLLGGAITAGAVETSSSTRFGAGGFTTSDAGALFVSLKVDGKAVARHVKPNTRMALKGLGYVVLDQETRTASPTGASLIVDGIHAVVTAPHVPGVAENTNIFVAHAMSGLEGPVVGLLTGEAYGTSHGAAKTSSSGPSFLNPMPCLGTKGRLVARTGAATTEPKAFTSGTVRNTVRGTVTPSTAIGTVTSTVHGATLLSGIVRAGVITAGARVEKTASGVRLSAPGSSFASLTVAGHPGINSNVPPNTKVLIPNMGILYLHRVIVTARSIEVRMIELVLTQHNSLGLPAGTDIRIAVANAGVR